MSGRCGSPAIWRPSWPGSARAGRASGSVRGSDEDVAAFLPTLSEIVARKREAAEALADGGDRL